MKLKYIIEIDTKKKLDKIVILDLLAWTLEMIGLEPDKEFKVILKK